MTSWKTTVGGLLVALGQVLITATSSPIAWWIGKGCLIFGPILLGSSAIDSKAIHDDAKK